MPEHGGEKTLGAERTPDVDPAVAAYAAPESDPESGLPGQQQLALAFVHGRPYTTMPRDLYIPPEALEVFLESFEGPLDLLLYLIRRQNLDILEINVAEITTQYMQYIELMDATHFELAAEYLVMSAMLAEIKSRMLLPRVAEEIEDGMDPRADLIRRLQEYERFKQAAEDIDALPRLDRDLFRVRAEGPQAAERRSFPEVQMGEILMALNDVLQRARMHESHHIEMEKLSTRERMSQILNSLQGGRFVPFVKLFTVEEGRIGVVVTFLAAMELLKESLIELVQTDAFAQIHIKARVE